MDWVSWVSDTVVAIAAAVAAGAGLNGLNVWKKQLAGKIEYDLARTLLRSVFQLRNAIANARLPYLQYAAEPDLPEEKLKQLSDDEKKWRALAQAYQKRWDPIDDAVTNVDTSTLEAEVVWGPGIVTKVSVLRKLVGELRWAITDYLEAQRPDEKHDNKDPKILNERMKIMYARGALEKDPFRQSLEKAIVAIEDEIRPKLRRYHTR